MVSFNTVRVRVMTLRVMHVLRKKATVQMGTNKVLYILECLDVMPGPENTTGKIACLKCEDLRSVIAVHVYEWHARCADKGCVWSRWTGLSKDLAVFLARKHSTTGHKTCAEYTQAPRAVAAERRLREAKVIP